MNPLFQPTHRIRFAATDFEDRHRLWIALSIYALAFALWPLDRRDVLGFIAEHVTGTPVVARLFYLLAAIPTFVAASLQTWSATDARSGDV